MSFKNSDLNIYHYRQRNQVDYPEGGPDMAKQEFKDECDINLIVPKAASTGIINHLSKTPPTYGDFTGSLDYQEALNHIIAADDSFQELPANVRDRMNNDPGKLLDFLADEENNEEAYKLGLKVKPLTSSISKPETEESTKSTTTPSGGE